MAIQVCWLGFLEIKKTNIFAPSHTSKKDKRYRYYISNHTNENQAVLLYPAAQIEDTVRNVLINWLRDDTQHRNTDAGDGFSQRQQRLEISELVRSGTPHQQKTVLHSLLKQAILYGLCLLIKSDGINREIQPKEKEDPVENLIKLDLVVRFKHVVKGRKIIIQNARQQLQKRDKKLITLIAKVHLWAKDLHSGKYSTMTELANQHGINKADLGKNIRLAYLDPYIVNAIMYISSD